MENTAYASYYTYIEISGAPLFTMVLLPSATGKFPVVITRTPYVDRYENEEEQTVLEGCLNQNKHWLDAGYAVVYQHCRGRGKSGGDCIPYINEREDGLALLDYVRKSPFYSGELYLLGQSYLTTVHYATAPFEEDIKGAVFGVQDSERYNICYRNGVLKAARLASWYVKMYKAKTMKRKNFTPEALNTLPLSVLSKAVFGEAAEDFDEMIRHPNPRDDFWNTRLGGIDTRDAVKHARFPILFHTGMFDIYTGGIFNMWRNMDVETRQNCALAVTAYNHSDTLSEPSVTFPGGSMREYCRNKELLWIDSIRRGENPPFEKGKVTYYSLFENCWRCDDFPPCGKSLSLKLGEETVCYTYNPYDAPSFKGGLCCNFGDTAFQDPPNSRYDIISVYTDPFAGNLRIQGRMKARLQVKSDCPDTCFYVRISIEKEGGDLGLRDDITSLCYQLGDYTPDSTVELDFQFDDIAFLIQKGERLRIDIASADKAHYVRHTNQKGLFSEQTTAQIAHNTVFLHNSTLTLPVAEK